MLTDNEKDALALTADLWNILSGIVGRGQTRKNDLKELMFHIHAIENAILAQSAAREYPEKYRTMGNG